MRTLAELRKTGMDIIVGEIQKIFSGDQALEKFMTSFNERKKREAELLAIQQRDQDQQTALAGLQAERQKDYESIRGYVASKEDATSQSLVRIMDTYPSFLEQYEKYEQLLLHEKSRNKNFDIISALQEWQEQHFKSFIFFLESEQRALHEKNLDNKAQVIGSIASGISEVVGNNFKEQLKIYKNRQAAQPLASEKHTRWLKPQGGEWAALSQKVANKPEEEIKPYVDPYSKPKELVTNKKDVSEALEKVAAYVKLNPQASVYINHFPEEFRSYAYQEAAVVGINPKNIVGYRSSSSEAQKAKQSYENAKQVIPRGERAVKSEVAGVETKHFSGTGNFDLRMLEPDFFAGKSPNDQKQAFKAMNFIQRADLLNSDIVSFDQKIQCLLALPFHERLFVLNESQASSPPSIDHLLVLKMASVLQEKLNDPIRKANFPEQLSDDLKTQFRLNEQLDKLNRLGENEIKGRETIWKGMMPPLTSVHLGLDNLSRDVADFIETKKKITSFPSTLSPENKAQFLTVIEKNSGELGRFVSSLGYRERVLAVNELLAIDKDLGSSVAAGLLCTLRNSPDKMISILREIGNPSNYRDQQKLVIQKLGGAAVVSMFLYRYSQKLEYDPKKTNIKQERDQWFELLTPDQKFYVLLALREKFKDEYTDYLTKASSGKAGYVDVLNVPGAAKVLMSAVHEKLLGLNDVKIMSLMQSKNLTINAKVEMIEVFHKKGLFNEEKANLLEKKFLEKLEKGTQDKDLKQLLKPVIESKKKEEEAKAAKEEKAATTIQRAWRHREVVSMLGKNEIPLSFLPLASQQQLNQSQQPPLPPPPPAPPSSPNNHSGNAGTPPSQPIGQMQQREEQQVQPPLQQQGQREQERSQTAIGEERQQQQKQQDQQQQPQTTAASGKSGNEGGNALLLKLLEEQLFKMRQIPTKVSQPQQKERQVQEELQHKEQAPSLPPSPPFDGGTPSSQPIGQMQQREEQQVQQPQVTAQSSSSNVGDAQQKRQKQHRNKSAGMEKTSQHNKRERELEKMLSKNENVVSEFLNLQLVSAVQASLPPSPPPDAGGGAPPPPQQQAEQQPPLQTVATREQQDQRQSPQVETAITGTTTAQSQEQQTQEQVRLSSSSEDVDQSSQRQAAVTGEQHLPSITLGRHDSLRVEVVPASKNVQAENDQMTISSFENPRRQKEERKVEEPKVAVQETFFNIAARLLKTFPLVAKTQVRSVIEGVIKKQDPESAHLLEDQQKSRRGPNAEAGTEQSSEYKKLENHEKKAKSAGQKTPPKTPPKQPPLRPDDVEVKLLSEPLPPPSSSSSSSSSPQSPAESSRSSDSYGPRHNSP